MTKIMFAWIGGTDHDAVTGNTRRSPGPIARAVSERRDFEHIHLLNNYRDRSSTAYKKWLRSTTKTKAKISSAEIELVTPTDFGAIYSSVRQEIDSVRKKLGKDTELVFNLSPGTYGMAAVWIILQQTLYPDSELLYLHRSATCVT